MDRIQKRHLVWLSIGKMYVSFTAHDSEAVVKVWTRKPIPKPISVCEEYPRRFGPDIGGKNCTVELMMLTCTYARQEVVGVGA